MREEIQQALSVLREGGNHPLPYRYRLGNWL